MITINANDEVWVKLTPVGEQMWADYWWVTEPKGVPESIRKSHTEWDGWVRFQLWELMQVFGKGMRNGVHVPFETDIRLTRG
jgi:hypothetical protein